MDMIREAIRTTRASSAPRKLQGSIEKLNGTMVAERLAPKDSFAGHQMHTPWDPLHLAYFNGEALWTYLATPFAFAMGGVRAEEIASWQEGKETWRVLRVYFPGSIGTHCEVQDFFFDEKFELRRHDYSVNIAGGSPASQLCWNILRQAAFACRANAAPIRSAPIGAQYWIC
jgi:hypothetical protein